MAGSTSESASDSTPWHESWIGRILVGQFEVCSLVALLLIVIGPAQVSVLVDTSFRLPFELRGIVQIFQRFYIYVYSFVGTMAFVFIRLFKNIDMSRTALFRVSLRVPAALLLVTVSYLLVTWSTGQGGDVGQIHWIVAFLVGFSLTYSVDTLDKTTVQVFRNLFEPPTREPDTERTEEDS